MKKQEFLKELKAQFEGYKGFSVEKDYGDFLITLPCDKKGLFIEFPLEELEDFLEELGGEKNPDWETIEVYDFEDEDEWDFSVSIKISSYLD